MVAGFFMSNRGEQVIRATEPKRITRPRRMRMVIVKRRRYVDVRDR